MLKKLLWLQSIILLAGTAFAYYTVYSDFQLFNFYEGTIFKLKDCVVPNPVLTPCFYGAFAFLVAFIWSLFILKSKEIFKQERRLLLLLIASTIFAWGNFFSVVIRYYTTWLGPKVSCSGTELINPLQTSCFIGSMIFLIALIVAIIILRFSKKVLG